jgi:geranylgeranyl diphosphate synthase type II
VNSVNDLNLIPSNLSGTSPDVTVFQERRSHLLPLIDQAISSAIDVYCSQSPDRLKDAITYSWLAPGKRLRPLLVLLTAEAAGADFQAAMPAAVAVEAIHCYSLIHDDLPAMDDDDLRRGRPTCHIQFDEATAILAGDALQPLAFAVLASEIPDAAIAQRALKYLANAAGASALVGGQMEDILAERHKIADADQLARIHRGKTGAMIRVSTQLGALLAGADERQLQAVTRFGDAIGLAFQIVDDLLDVESDAESMGKRTGKDAKLGKLTYPSIYGIESSRRRANELVEQAIEALSIFDSSCSGLIGLAQYVCHRSN